MRTRSRLLAAVVAGGLLLTACGDEAATEDGLVRSLTEAPDGGRAAVNPEQARCIAETLFGQFDEDQISAIAGAASPDELPAGAGEAINQAYDECVEPAGS